MCTYDVCLLDSRPICDRVRERHTKLNDIRPTLLHGEQERDSVFGGRIPGGDECEQRRAGLTSCSVRGRAMYGRYYSQTDYSAGIPSLLRP